MSKKTVAEILMKVMEAEKVEFVMKDRSLSYQEVFSDRGLLPAMARRADNLCSLALGYGIGAEFKKEKASTTGSAVSFDDSVPQALTILMIYDVIKDLMAANTKGKKTILDELLYD